MLIIYRHDNFYRDELITSGFGYAIFDIIYGRKSYQYFCILYDYIFRRCYLLRFNYSDVIIL